MSQQVYFKVAVNSVIGTTPLNAVTVNPYANDSIGGGKMMWAQDDLLHSTTQTKNKPHCILTCLQPG